MEDRWKEEREEKGRHRNRKSPTFQNGEDPVWLLQSNGQSNGFEELLVLNVVVQLLFSSKQTS